METKINKQKHRKKEQHRGKRRGKIWSTVEQKYVKMKILFVVPFEVAPPLAKIHTQMVTFLSSISVFLLYMWQVGGFGNRKLARREVGGGANSNDSKKSLSFLCYLFLCEAQSGCPDWA